MTVAVGAGGMLSSGEYFGRVVARGGASGFFATETSYRAGEDLPRHAHERAFFCLTLSGAYAESTRSSRETVYAPFTAVFHPAGEIHVTRMAPAGGRVFNVEVDPALLPPAGGAAPAPMRDLDGGALVWLLARLRCASLRANPRDPDPGPASEVESLGLELVGALCRESDPGRTEPPWLARVVERLRDEAAAREGQARPSVASLAAEAGVHPVHLARVFRRHHRETIASYVRRVRVQRAARLLSRRGADAGSAVSLAAVASSLGFADQSHMTRAFRRIAGTTPAAVRRSEA